MIKIPYLEPSLDLTGRHKCNTTDFSRISADLLRHGKTIIGEEDDKLTMNSICPPSLFTVSHT